MNEKNYYRRMSDSLKDKLKILDYMDEGDKVLDFGAGTADIAKYVNEKGYYTAYDWDEELQEFYGDEFMSYLKHPLDIPSLEDSSTRFDIIYLSSVTHEMFSTVFNARQEDLDWNIAYSNALDNLLGTLFKELPKILNPNGKIIIRDWMNVEEIYPEGYKLYVNPTAVDDFSRFLTGFTEQNKNVGISMVKDTTLFEGSSKDLYEVLYHYNWGEQSEYRENKEVYGVLNPGIIINYLIKNQIKFKMKARQAYFDEGYLPYLINKLTLVKNGNVAPYFPTKMFTVIELN